MNSRRVLLLLIAIVSVLAVFLVTPPTRAGKPANLAASSSRAASGGLREVVDAKYKKRYADWKNEFLSADIGRVQWELYTNHPHLVLTITVADDVKYGAGTGTYKWNDEGELVAATIVLGNRIDQGYPSSVYYPVMMLLSLMKLLNFSGRMFWRPLRSHTSSAT